MATLSNAKDSEGSESHSLPEITGPAVGSTRSVLSRRASVLFVIVAGVSLRFAAAGGPSSADFDSYVIVAELRTAGENVYAGTSRYNYGPIWFHVLTILYEVAGRELGIFRTLVVGVLSLVDIGIGAVLLKRFSRRAAYLFFLIPISIIVSGHQNQFDNVAILMGMLAVQVYGEQFDRPLDRRKLAGLTLLGLSLATKHVLFLFPIWLAVKQKGPGEKLVVAFVPVAIFLITFLPYWQEGHEGIINNVLLYESRELELFYRLFIPGFLRSALSSTAVWLIILSVLAVVLSGRPGLESLVFYCAVLVAAAPATASQYLAIATPFSALYFNPWTMGFLAIGSVFLLFDSNGLIVTISGVPWPRQFIYGLLVFLLVLGVARALWKTQGRTFWQRISPHFRIQTSGTGETEDRRGAD